MDLLLIIGSVQAFFLGILLLFRNTSSLSNRLLVVWMIVLGLNLLGVYLGTTGFYRQNPNYFGWDAALPLLHGPLLFIYVNLSIKQVPKWRPLYFLHFLPYIFFAVYIPYRAHSPTVVDRYTFIREMFFAPDLPILIFEISIHFIVLIYIFLAHRTLKRFRSKLPDLYSYTEGIDMNWLRVVLGALLFISFVIIGSVIASDVLRLFSLDFKAALFYGTLALLPFYLTFFHQSIVYPSDDLMTSSAPTKKYSNSTLTPQESLEMRDRLDDLMRVEKLYLDSRLSISKLAIKLSVHPKALSQIINEQHQMTFFNFVNKYRVQEAKDRISNPDYNHLTLLGIGLDCGFNTKSSFNSVFRKFTNQTPSQYRSSLVSK